ncbi:MAG TPA: sulfurtransferase [Candidatus Micrarchaeia archaeon]|nr:sulfurtransferase [Candidatus Micrarchaeia archaeon]
MSDYARPDVLVTTAWLADHLQDRDLVVIDVDEDTTAYQRGHIPGAKGVHWRDDLQDPIRRDFVGPEGFSALMDRLGVTRDTRVVLYGGNKNWFAAYAYWYFTYYGHPLVQLLDGGRRKWELEGRPLTAEVAPASPAHGYRPGPGDPAIRIFRDDVAAQVLGRPDATLVDVRSPEEFRGERLTPDHLPNEGAQKAGHIPGARNIPWSKAVDAEQETFLPADQLRALYQAEGVTPDKDVVAYCRIGERSAHTWFVLHELLGYPKVRNYDGSWTEWGSLVRAPIER